MPSIPKAILHFLVELVKHQAKQKLGDNALNVLAKSLADYAGDDATEKLTAFLDQGGRAEQVLAAFQQADTCFRRRDLDYAQMMASKPLAALERLEILAARFSLLRSLWPANRCGWSSSACCKRWRMPAGRRSRRLKSVS